METGKAQWLPGVRVEGWDEQTEHRGFGGSEATLHATIMMAVSLYIRQNSQNVRQE